MDNQCSEEFVKEQFERVLSTVQEVARQKVCSLTNTVQEVLVEELNDHEDGLVTGRLSNNTMVHFKGDESMIGKFVSVKLIESKNFYYFGEEVK